VARGLTALVEPDVLRWARESIGLTPQAAARKIGLSDETLVEQWEDGTAVPTIAKLREAARVYKRPLAVLFLPRPPDGSFDVMHDFRRLPDAEARLWSPELHGEFRRANDQRDVALEIADLAQEPIPQTWRLPEPLPDNDEDLAAAARRNLIEGAPLRFPVGGDEFAHLGFWIAALEEAGVLVLTSNGVSVNEMRGFSLHFDELPVIVVNGSDFARGRLFSLLHEYAHLILHTDGLCDMAPGVATTADLRLEVRCNAIAAAILMPRAMVLGLPDVAVAPPGYDLWTDDALETGAKTFGVSVEAFLRRLLTLGRTTEPFYRRKRRDLLRGYDEALARRKEEGGGGNWYRTKVRNLGKGYVRGVISAHQRSLIDTYTAASYLDAKVQQLARLGQEATLRADVS
jgi:Zn-dependent peptidase ImmA (M78 family)/DNA-binding XRE family transcriptional regulator